MSRILRKKLFQCYVNKVRFLPLLGAKLIHSTHLNPISVTLILIWSSLMHLYLLSTLFPSGFLTKIACIPFLLRKFLMLHLLQYLDLLTQITGEQTHQKNPLCVFFPTRISYASRKNIFHCTVSLKNLAFVREIFLTHTK
jgi:hypothetical protein